MKNEPSSDAESAVLRDVTMVLDELLAQCVGAGRIAERVQVSAETGLAIADRSFPDGLSLVFDRGQRSEVRLHVLDRLLDRVLDLPDVRRWAQELDERFAPVGDWGPSLQRKEVAA